MITLDKILFELKGESINEIVAGRKKRKKRRYSSVSSKSSKSSKSSRSS